MLDRATSPAKDRPFPLAKDSPMPHLNRDGIALAYDRIDGPGRPVVLVHGWCCDRRFFAPQATHFAALGHTVVSVDLRGHGESDKPVQPYPISGFADDLAWLCTQLGLSRPLVIGHSMGGIVAFDLATRHPDLPGGVVMLDSSIIPTEASHRVIPGFIAALRGPEHREALRHLVSTAFFLPTDDPAQCRWILDVMSSAPQHVMSEAYAGILGFDARAAQGRLRVPLLYISANEPAARCDIAALAALFPQIAFGRTVGSGHFCQLEVPDQVNAMIDRFVTTSLDPR